MSDIKETATRTSFCIVNGEHNDYYAVDATMDGLEIEDICHTISWEWILNAYAAVHGHRIAVVPVVPTEAMLKAGYWAAHDEDAEQTWQEMVAAGRLDHSEMVTVPTA